MEISSLNTTLTHQEPRYILIHKIHKNKITNRVKTSIISSLNLSIHNNKLTKIEVTDSRLLDIHQKRLDRLSINSNATVIEPTLNKTVIESTLNKTVLTPNSNATVLEPNYNTILMTPNFNSNATLLAPKSNSNATVLEPNYNATVLEPNYNATLLAPNSNTTVVKYDPHYIIPLYSTDNESNSVYDSNSNDIPKYEVKLLSFTRDEKLLHEPIFYAPTSPGYFYIVDNSTYKLKSKKL